MHVTTAQREELDALSKDVFGATSRWQTILKKGYNEPQKQLTKKSTFFVKRYHTVESVKELMLDLRKKRNEHMAALKKKQDEEKALDQSIKNAVGSAI
jgi:phosphoketolase